MLQPWSEIAPRLVDVAMGRKQADLVVRNGRWVNVYSGEIVPGADVAIVGGRFAYVGRDAGHTIGEGTKIVDAAGRYLVPGLCDGHMHVESGLVTVTEFARAVIPHGTTTMFVDPHEIANVLGMAGVKLMNDEAQTLPVNIFVQVPSCVPSAPGLENAGATLSAADVREALAWPNIIGLGEMMNFPGVAANDSKMVAEIAATRAAGLTVGGHYASPDLGRAFHAYAAGGRQTTTREPPSTTRSRAFGRACGPCFVSARPGSTWRHRSRLLPNGASIHAISCSARMTATLAHWSAMAT